MTLERLIEASIFFSWLWTGDTGFCGCGNTIFYLLLLSLFVFSILRIFFPLDLYYYVFHEFYVDTSPNLCKIIYVKL